MNELTASELIQLIGVIASVFIAVGGLVLTIGGWFVVSKLNKANTDKAKAEAATIYQDMANQSAQREKELLDKVLEVQKANAELKSEVKKMGEAIATKDKIILELQTKSEAQAIEINKLQDEIHVLQLKRK